MKVLLLNGSPHEKGTTYRALKEVSITLESSGVDTEILWIGNKPIAGCNVCGGCNNKGKCVVDDLANVIIDKMETADGLVIGSPVYYASLNGSLKGLLDRVFFAKRSFAYKVGAAVAVARRAGTTATLDIINKYFMLSNMPVVSSQYWNMVFGSNDEQAEQDEEGLQTMRVLGNNISWLLKCIDEGRKNGMNPPNEEPHIRTNFYKN